MVSVVVASAISEDSSEEGESGDVSGHGDLNLFCLVTHVFLF